MKVTKQTLYLMRLEDAVRKHFDAKIIDRSAMLYEIRQAVEWRDRKDPKELPVE